MQDQQPFQQRAQMEDCPLVWGEMPGGGVQCCLQSCLFPGLHDILTQNKDEPISASLISVSQLGLPADILYKMQHFNDIVLTSSFKVALCCFCFPVTRNYLFQHIIKQLFKLPAVMINLVRFSFWWTGSFLAGQPRCHLILDLLLCCPNEASTEISGRFKNS